MAKYYRSVRVLQGSDGPSAEGSTDKGYHVSESKSTPTMGAQDSPEAIDLYLLAWEEGVKTIYYVRSKSLEVEECEVCSS